ncbi:MAG TPA: hypothetical protein VGO53_05240 [Steroidobacteraceae bacterium]|nr:hypothetical protein [Steroidobacteraceae bacterium]
MLKPLLLGICIVISAAGCATTPKAPMAATATETPQPAVTPDCVTSGTRIPLREGECSGQPGRTWSKTDLDRTGQTNVADALRQLDPSIGR